LGFRIFSSLQYDFKKQNDPGLIDGRHLMEYTRVGMAALVGFVAYFVIGGLTFAVLPWLKIEFAKYPLVYRSPETMILSSGVWAGGGCAVRSADRGFAVGSFVVHNCVNLNIGLKLTVQQSVAYFVEWIVVGMVIGLIYRSGQ
jgi:hypothetical protein